MSKSRGIRNNNPGNLVKTSSPWKGKVPHSRNTDPTFEQFEDWNGVKGYLWGLRAMFIDLRGDVFKDGKNTIRRLIEEYAPKHENNTEVYIAEVARAVGKSANETLTIHDFPALMAAITKHENGKNPYHASDFEKAMSLA